MKKILYAFNDLFFLILSTLNLVRYPRTKYPKLVGDKSVRILANGPSLSVAADNSSDDCEYCLLNMSPVSDIFWQVKPKYYIQADPAFFLRYKDHEITKNTVAKLQENVDWDLIMFVPTTYLKIAQSLYSGNKHIKIVHFGSVVPIKYIKNPELRLWLYQKGLSLPIVQNVVVGAIYCLIKVGCKNIELYGVDHSWTKLIIVDENNQVCQKNVHYYDKEENVEYTPWKKWTGEPYRIYECLRDIAQMFDSYEELRKYADSLGDVRIINKTKGSFIDAFERG